MKKNPSRARPGAEMAKRLPRARWALNLPVLLLAMLLFLSGCGARFSVAQLERETCSKKRLKAAAITLDEAKEQFAEHFKLRSDTALRYAYLASVDSVRLARSIRTCFDFRKEFKPRAVELIRANRSLRRLIVKNLRDRDPQLAIGVFGEEYREIFKNDIN